MVMITVVDEMVMVMAMVVVETSRGWYGSTPIETYEDKTLPHETWMRHSHGTVAEMDARDRHGKGRTEGDGDRVTTLPFTHGKDTKKKKWRKRQRHTWKGGKRTRHSGGKERKEIRWMDTKADEKRRDF